MSKYFDKNFTRDIGRNISGVEIFQPNIDEEFIKLIFANIISGNVSYLFEKISPDINLNFTDENNNSVVHLLLKADSKLITEETKINLLKFFINHNAPLNSYNREKLTPLHIAILNGDTEIVKFLIDHRVNLNAPTNNNLNPLFLALKNNVNMCPDLIMPKELNKDEKKDENELKKKIQEDIINLFINNYTDPTTGTITNYKQYLDIYLKKIFEDFIEGRNYSKESVDNIIKKYKESIKKSENSDQNIENKFNLELNNSIESLKKEFDIHLDNKTAHPFMKTYGIDAVPFSHPKMDEWRR
jgi:ankyrin repeat protein